MIYAALKRSSTLPHAFLWIVQNSGREQQPGQRRHCFDGAVFWLID
jgi:hypothetical protein